MPEALADGRCGAAAYHVLVAATDVGCHVLQDRGMWGFPSDSHALDDVPGQFQLGIVDALDADLSRSLVGIRRSALEVDRAECVLVVTDSGSRHAVCPGSQRVHPEYATSLIGHVILDTRARSAGGVYPEAVSWVPGRLPHKPTGRSPLVPQPRPRVAGPLSLDRTMGSRPRSGSSGPCRRHTC